MPPLILKKLLPPCLIVAALVGCIPTLEAGQRETKASVDLIEQPRPAADLWEITVKPYGWMAGLDGTTGVAGYTAKTDLDFSTILKNLDMVAMMQVDVRYDRWLLLLDGQYLRMSADTQPSGKILSTAGLELEQIMVEAALGYRVLRGERGYLDVFAGARYMSVEGELTLDVNSTGVREVSRNLSRSIVDRVLDAVRQGAGPAVHDKIAEGAKERIRDRLEDIINRPHISNAVIRRGPVREAIRELVEARAEEARAKIEAAQQKILDRARRAVQKAERKLAKELERAIRDAIRESASGRKDWVDPIIGLRGRWNFAGPCYLAGRADIGGFGVGSNLAWQVYGGLGCQVTRNFTVELGYRHLAVDYTSGGFTYDVSMSGAVLAAGITF